MRLGVDGWRLHGSLTGVGRYVSNVLRYWTPEALASRFEEVTLYTPGPVDREAIGLPETIRERVVGPHWRKLVWETLRLGPSVTDDVLFCPSYSRPLVTRATTVVTIFEATQKLYPEHYPWQTRVIHSPLYGIGARRSALVITSSAAAGKDVVAAYGVDPARLRVVHLAAAENFHVVDDPVRVEEARGRYAGTGAPFFLYVGKLTARRNIPTLIDAFGALKRATSLPHRLVLVGLNTTDLDIAALAARAGVPGDVVHHPFVADDDLVLLYNGAEAFVLPYTYEAAFSLTAIEAQATGAPVITVDAPGLRESTGGAALFVPEVGVRQLADAMERLATDAELRAELAATGLANARTFSWKRTSEATLDALWEAARMGNGT